MIMGAIRCEQVGLLANAQVARSVVLDDYWNDHMDIRGPARDENGTGNSLWHYCASRSENEIERFQLPTIDGQTFSPSFPPTDN